MRPTEVVVQATRVSDAEGLARRTLEAALGFAGGRGAALFLRDEDDLELFSSVGLEQSALEAVQEAWSTQRERLLAAEVVLANTQDVGRAVVPVDDAGQLVGLLYVEGSAPFQVKDAQVLIQFAGIASMALALAPAPEASAPDAVPFDAYLARTSPEDVDRRQLIALLQHNGWNIAKVARRLDVTRATIYNRIERLGIERQRMRRAVSRRQDA